MPNHLTPAEQAQLAKIDAQLSKLKQDRAAILNRKRQRAFLARQKAQD